MRYFIVNIIRKESKLITVDVYVSKGFVPIFYGETTVEQILNDETSLTNNKKKDAKLFCETFYNRVPDDVRIIAIGSKSVYILKPVVAIQETQKPLIGVDGLLENVIKKYIKVEVVKEEEIKKTPLVLSSMRVNRWFSSGTFKEINDSKYVGNILAIKYLLGEKVFADTPLTYLKCLSSIELETLIAKVFEELGCFVPAYKGGFLKDIDLIAENISKSIIKVTDDVFIEKGEARTVQIKLTLEKKDVPDNPSDIFICLENNSGKTKNVIDADGLYTIIKSLEKTSFWLQKSLRWVNIK